MFNVENIHREIENMRECSIEHKVPGTSNGKEMLSVNLDKTQLINNTGK